MYPFVDEIIVNDAQILIKFGISIKTSTLINANFLLSYQTASPSEIANPFKTIVLADDYNSISRVLTLEFNSGVLQASTDYELLITNLKNASGVTQSNAIHLFSTDSDPIPTPEEERQQPPEVTIIDHSIVPDVVFVDTSSTASSDTVFALVESDPENWDVFLPEDYNKGVVTLKFNIKPNSDFLTSTYFFAQKKAIQRRPGRWETVSIVITEDPSYPWVYIKFPSNDATPVYDTSGAVYYEENYKYRVRISKDLGI